MTKESELDATGRSLLNLLRAIRSKESCAVTYQGKRRVFSPHMLAKTHPKGESTEGRLVVHAYQWGGAGSKGEVTPETGGWRYFYLDEMNDSVAFAGDSWYPVPNEELEKKERMTPAFIETVIAFVGQTDAKQGNL